MNRNQSFLSLIIERVLLILPWIFIVWLIAQAAGGELNWLLVIVLLVIFIPVAFFLNIITMVLVRGRAFLKELVKSQRSPRTKTSAGEKEGRKQAQNLADLPWWDPRRYLQ